MLDFPTFESRQHFVSRREGLGALSNQLSHILIELATAAFIIQFSAWAKAPVSIENEHESVKMRDFVFRFSRVVPQNLIRANSLVVSICGDSLWLLKLGKHRKVSSERVGRGTDRWETCSAAR